MIGFQVTINDTHLIQVAAISSQLLFYNVEDHVVLFVTGIDERDNSLRWPRHVLKVGDKINIKVKDLMIIDEPDEIKKDIEYLKERYYRLKVELENNGLL